MLYPPFTAVLILAPPCLQIEHLEAKRQAMHETVQRHRESRSAAEAEAGGAKAQVQRLAHDLEELQAKRTSLKGDIAKIEAQREAVAAEAQVADRQRVLLQQEVQRKRVAPARRPDADTLVVTTTQIDDERAALNKLKDLHRDAETARADAAHVVEALRVARSERAAAIAQRDSVQAELKQLQVHLDDATSRAETAEARCKALANQYEAADSVRCWGLLWAGHVSKALVSPCCCCTGVHRMPLARYSGSSSCGKSWTRATGGARQRCTTWKQPRAMPRRCLRRLLRGKIAVKPWSGRCSRPKLRSTSRPRGLPLSRRTSQSWKARQPVCWIVGSRRCGEVGSHRKSLMTLVVACSNPSGSNCQGIEGAAGGRNEGTQQCRSARNVAATKLGTTDGVVVHAHTCCFTRRCAAASSGEGGARCTGGNSAPRAQRSRGDGAAEPHAGSRQRDGGSVPRQRP